MEIFQPHLLGRNAVYCFQSHAGSCLAYSAAQEMAVTCSSETSVDLQQTTERYVPEDGTS
jgi:hypothetical protein